MTNLCFCFIVAESLLRSLQNIPQTHASEVIHVAPADEDFSFTWRCTFSPGFPIPEWGEKQLFLSPNSHHTSNSSSCVQSTYWTNHCFLSETQTRSVVQKILEQMLVRLFGQGVAAPLWEICGPEETIRGDSVDPPFCFQWCSLPGKTLSRDLPLCLYMTTYSSCFQSTAHLLFVGTTLSVRKMHGRCWQDSKQSSPVK